MKEIHENMRGMRKNRAIRTSQDTNGTDLIVDSLGNLRRSSEEGSTTVSNGNTATSAISLQCIICVDEKCTWGKKTISKLGRNTRLATNSEVIKLELPAVKDARMRGEKQSKNDIHHGNNSTRSQP